MSRLFFPLRTSVELFPDPTSVRAAARAKEAVVLYEEVIFEAGLYRADISEAGSFDTWVQPDQLTPEQLSDSRQLPQPGGTFSLSMGAQPSEGTPAPPEAMKTIFSAPLQASYVAEWHSDAIDELRRLAPQWASYVVLSDNGEAIRELGGSIGEAAGAFSELGSDVGMKPWVRSFAEKALARDAVLAAAMGAAFSVTSLFEPLLGELGVEADASGRVPLEILVPEVGALPWEAIAQYREHPGCEDARGKLREFEQRATDADPDDPMEFEREVFRAISADLFAAIADLRGTLTGNLAEEAAKTAVSFIPIIGPIIGPGSSVAQIVSEQLQQQHTWYAALMKLQLATKPPD